MLYLVYGNNVFTNSSDVKRKPKVKVNRPSKLPLEIKTVKFLQNPIETRDDGVQ